MLFIKAISNGLWIALQDETLQFASELTNIGSIIQLSIINTEKLLLGNGRRILLNFNLFLKF